MNNKVLIKLNMLSLDDTFDLFLPVNEIIWKIKRMILKSVSDLTGININATKDYILLNKENNRVYHNNEIIIDTDIRNGTELLMFIDK